MKIFKDIVSVIDFGSSKITMLTGKEEVNKSFKLLSSVDIDYDGYSSGEFIEARQKLEAIGLFFKQSGGKINGYKRKVYS